MFCYFVVGATGCASASSLRIEPHRHSTGVTQPSNTPRRLPRHLHDNIANTIDLQQSLADAGLYAATTGRHQELVHRAAPVWHADQDVRGPVLFAHVVHIA